MFRIFKRLFGDTNSKASVSNSSSGATLEAANRPSPAPAQHAPPPPAPRPSVQCLEIPLATIAERLSPALRSRLTRGPTRADVLQLPLASALEQLPRGAIRVSFRELREHTSPGIFAGGSESDAALVEVPLPEVLSRLQQSHLARRLEQKRVVVSDNVPSVFASREAASRAVRVSKPAETLHAPAARDEQASSRMIARAAAHDGPKPNTVVPLNPIAPVEPAATAPSTAPGQPPATVTKPVRSDPAPQPIPFAPDGLAQRAASPHDPEPVKVPFVPLTKGWPDAIRRESMATHLASSVTIPFPELEAAMKRGKAVFTWKQIRLWLSPKPSADLALHDAVELELPLSVLTPLFLARLSAGAAPKKVVTTAGIPDLFTPRKAGEPAVEPPPSAPAPREAAALEAKSKSLEQRITQSLALNLGNSHLPSGPAPAKQASTPLGQLTLARASALPSELVRRACQLSGVAGALLATPDGLVIASQLPPGMGADTAAAFLPQIHSRLGQYTRELKLGEPSQIEMVAGTISLQIFSTRGAYFAVLGKAGESLPKAQLASLAGQLSQATQ